MQKRRPSSRGSLGLSLLAFLFTMTPLAAGKTVKQVLRGDGQYPPQEFTEDGRLQGLHVDIVNAVGQELGWQMLWRSLPWKRALKEIESGTADLITFARQTPEREPFAWFPNNLGFQGIYLSNSEMALFTLKERSDTISFTGNLQELASRGLTVGSAFEFDYGEEFRAAKFKEEKLSDERAILRMLLAKRIDLGIGERLTMTYLVGLSALEEKVELLRPFLHPAFQHVAFSKKTAASVAEQEAAKEDARKFYEALGKFKETAAYRAILQRYNLAN